MAAWRHPTGLRTSIEAPKSEASPAKQQRSTNPVGSDETAIAFNQFIVRAYVRVILGFARLFEVGDRVPETIALLKERGGVRRLHVVLDHLSCS